MASPPSAAVSPFCGRTTVTGTLQCNTIVSILVTTTTTHTSGGEAHHNCWANPSVYHPQVLHPISDLTQVPAGGEVR